MDKSLVLKGASPNITLRSRDLEKPVFTVTGEKTDIRMENLTVTNAPSSPSVPIEISGKANLTLADIVVRSASAHAAIHMTEQSRLNIQVASLSGELAATEQAQVTANQLQFPAYGGLYLRGSARLVLLDSKIKADVGVSLWEETKAIIRKTSILGNTNIVAQGES